ncbi:FMN-binding negative transcriptional regulator [Leptospira sarikeiensis]|uniref:FMN-binding negative transcriptional regulator n=1 Tax=Leptospira sarikeiensis TaxID=2484943 RepID=A0A4R9K130_9LEPT|nr:FMN-binding negative transcriptional regulator [Leptospira sarikeiensis]TGL57668.1 FMN-binding negative transcriptional regulator [Leptospira sarikeiensis]
MYTPEHFKLEDLNIIHEIIGKYPFAVFVSNLEQGLEATHIPLLLSSNKNSLVGHMASVNPLLKKNTNVLCIFHGPHAYISPTWYETDQTVPTWNYISVHAKGTMKILDAVQTEKILEESILYFESESSDYKYGTPKLEIKKALLGKIKGFEITDLSFEAKIKLSQNHPIERRKNVIRELEKTGYEEEKDLAAWMKKINQIEIV